METLDIILIGYGVLLVYLVWDNTQAHRRLDVHEDCLDETIQKHNQLVEDIAAFADEMDDAFYKLEKKKND